MEAPSREPVSSKFACRAPQEIPLLLSLRIFLLFLLPPQIYAQDRVAIDVKTTTGGKIDLAPVEVGTTVCLNQSDWANVSEIGEDYSLWLKSYERIKKGENTEARLTLELRTPAFLRSGSLITSRTAATNFRTTSDGMVVPDTLHWNQEDLNAVREAIGEELYESASDLKREALIVGTATYEEARSLVEQTR
jgi:hypothetical protein